MVAPLLRRLAAAEPLTVYSQDDPAFPTGVHVVDDTNLEISDALDVEIVPTLLRVKSGTVIGRTPRRKGKFQAVQTGPGPGSRRA